MIRIIFLLAPVFVSLFWAVTLMGDKKKYSAPRLFLAKYMFLAALLFASHFVYFAPLPDMYFYFDIPLQLMGLSVFPLYHIYFRLLTVDAKFSFKTHSRYLVIPVIVGLIYGLTVFLTPVADYKEWLYNPKGEFPGGSIRFLIVMRKIIRITFAGSILLSLAGNYWLIKKYGHKAQQFYSDIRDAKQKNARMLIFSILVMGVLSLVIQLTGRAFLLPKDFFIYSGWSMFTVMLYLIGNSGLQQKTLNPYFEPAGITKKEYLPLKTTVKEWEKLQAQILEEFAVNKIYLNSDLNIVDIVKKLGTNRTYLSAFINQQYNQNFCSFVNDYRIKEVQKVMRENPECTSQYLADHCGFGSVNSMKRSVYARSAISLSELKNQAYSSE